MRDGETDLPDLTLLPSLSLPDLTLVSTLLSLSVLLVLLRSTLRPSRMGTLSRLLDWRDLSCLSSSNINDDQDKSQIECTGDCTINSLALIHQNTL